METESGLIAMHRGVKLFVLIDTVNNSIIHYLVTDIFGDDAIYQTYLSACAGFNDRANILNN